MIQIYIPPTDATFGGPFDRDTLVSELEQRGLTLRRVERLEAAGIVLLFAALDGPVVASLDAAARRRIVLVAEGPTPKPEEAETAREASGFLGLVEPRAWSNWRRGLVVTWGVYGRPDIATAAGLELQDGRGLQLAGGKRERLAEVLARFLAAAELAATGSAAP